MRYVVVLFLLLTLLSCKSSPTGPQVSNTVQLSADYVSCTEVWMKLGFANDAAGGEYRLTRDGDTLFAGTFSGSGTVLMDTTVQPNRTYSYQAYRVLGGQIAVLSSPVRVNTPDTTDNDISWQKFILGDGNSSILQDVTIAGDTIYAAGQIYTNDSTGTIDPLPYCLARWDGEKWGLLRLKYFPPGAIGDSAIAVGTAVFANSGSDIWLAAGAMFHFDGKVWTPVYNTNGAGGARRMWEDGGGNLWCVGLNGLVVHYSKDEGWQRIQSGTTLDFTDIWGATDTETGETQILASCTRNYPAGQMLMDIAVADVTPLSLAPLQYELFGVWFIPNQHYYLVGDGIYEKTFLSESVWHDHVLQITRYSTTAARGLAINDVFVGGAYGEVLHYNGTRWKSFMDNGTGVNGGYAGIAVTSRLICAVGEDYPKAAALIGRR